MKPPQISRDPNVNDKAANERYLRKLDKKEQDERTAEESYEQFNRAESATPRQLYRSVSKQPQPQPSNPFATSPKSKQISYSSSTYRRAGANQSTKEHKERSPFTLITERGARRSGILSGAVARWSWMLTIFQLCCCQTVFIWAIGNILVSLAGTYFYNKGIHSTGTMLGILSIVLALAMLFVAGLGPSAVATQFFTLK